MVQHAVRFSTLAIVALATLTTTGCGGGHGGGSGGGGDTPVSVPTGNGPIIYSGEGNKPMQTNNLGSEHRPVDLDEPFEGEFSDAAASADGTSIAFVTRAKDTENQNSQIGVLALASGKVTHVTDLTSLTAASPSLSADGTRLVYEASKEIYGSAGLYVTDSDGGGKAEAITDGGTTFTDTGADISPDDTRVVFSRHAVDCAYEKQEAGTCGDGIAVVDIDGGKITLLAKHMKMGSDEGSETGFTEAHDPEWSPDGSSIVFAARDAEGTAQLFVMKADGSEIRAIRKLTEAFSVSGANPTWSPDSSEIAFADAPGDGGSEIMVTSADGTELHTPTDKTESPQYGPAWVAVKANSQ